MGKGAEMRKKMLVVKISSATLPPDNTTSDTKTKKNKKLLQRKPNMCPARLLFI